MIGWRRRGDCCPVLEWRDWQKQCAPAAGRGEDPARAVSGPGFGLRGSSVSPHDATTSVQPNLPHQISMSTIHWKRFLHPGGVYQLEYPAHWEQVQKDEARSCGFGPHDRDDVGLWISVMPISVDTDQL